MTDDDEFIDDENLLLEAARYAVRQGVQRNKFMTLAKRCWFEADAERRGAEWERRRIRAKTTNQ